MTTKEEALSALEKSRAEYLKKARAVAVEVFNKKGSVTTDDVRLALPIPEGIDGRVMGAVFNSNEWQKVGYTESVIKSSHRRPIAIFKLKS